MPEAKELTVNEQMMSTRQVADFCGVSTRTIGNWISAGKISAPARLPNGRPAWPESVVKDFVKYPDAQAA